MVFCEAAELWHEDCEMGPGWGRCAGRVVSRYLSQQGRRNLVVTAPVPRLDGE